MQQKTYLLLGFVVGVVLTLLFVLLFPSLIAAFMAIGLIIGAIYVWVNFELLERYLKTRASEPSEDEKP